jgi:phasin
LITIGEKETAAMAKDPTPHFEIPTDMRALAEKSVEQARKAFDTFISAAHGAATAFEHQATAVKAGSEDVRQRAMTFAEQNVNASFEFAQKLVRAKDLQEMIKLQTEYAKTQMQTLSEQAKELGETTAQSVQKAAKPKTGS